MLQGNSARTPVYTDGFALQCSTISDILLRSDSQGLFSTLLLLHSHQTSLNAIIGLPAAIAIRWSYNSSCFFAVAEWFAIRRRYGMQLATTYHWQFDVLRRRRTPKSWVWL